MHCWTHNSVRSLALLQPLQLLLLQPGKSAPCENHQGCKKMPVKTTAQFV